MKLNAVRHWRDAAAVLLMALCISAHAGPPETAIPEVQKLNEQARTLSDQGQYSAAMPLAQRALQLSEKELGPKHPETASSLDTIAEVHLALGAYAQAEPLYRRALAIREEVLGPQHASVADSLNNLGSLYGATGSYAKAEPLLLRALAIREKVLGPKDQKVGGSLANLAILYSETGAYAKAEPLYQRSLAIYEKALGPEHPETAGTLDSLAVLYSQIGTYAKAEPLFQRALAIREKVLGREHPVTALSLNHLGILYAETGAYTKAEAPYLRALAIREKALGPEHPDTTASLGNLADLYLLSGAYAKAEPLFQRALAIREKTLGPEDPKMANALENLALLYKETGAYAKAEPLYQRALAIREKALGPEHPQTADSLDNLANLYLLSGAYAEAEPRYQRALAIRQKVLGPQHASLAESLNNLADLYSEIGTYAKAEPLYRRALAIFEKALGPEHPRTGECLDKLATLYRDVGTYAKAEPLYQRALAIFEKALGPEHPFTASSLDNLASLYFATAAYAKAELLYQRAQVIRAKNSERFLVTGSESRKQAYVQEIAKNTYRNVSFSVAAGNQSSVALGLTSVLHYKGRILDEVSGSVARLRQSVKPADRGELFEQLAEVANQFSSLTYQGLEDLSSAQYRQRLKELSQRQEVLEADLAKRSVDFRRQVTPITIAAVSRAIPVGAVLVEWFRYQPFDPKKPGAKAQQGSPRYVAYVLKAGGEPSLVDVGDAQVIETSVNELLDAMRDPTSSDAQARARNLSDKIVKPLRAYLNGAQRLLISPDGLLNSVPMAALLDENGQYLVQRFEITYLTSGRDLLRMAAASGSQSGAIVIANPDYGSPTRVLAPAKPEAQRSAELDRSGFLFQSLPNTAAEAQTLKSLLKLSDSSVLMGREATESRLKQLHGPRILHVASHGFFLSDQKLRAELGPKAKQTLYNSENPLLRAGIALAGANTRRSGASEDGILTALEVAQLDLRGTELVVLSACDTGVGQVQNGEGVYGLRRALFIAGAQTQVTSLWRVADGSTRRLMVDYYERLLKGEGRSAALRAAQQRMLTTPQRSHPFWWASFVSIGDWAPLDHK